MNFVASAAANDVSDVGDVHPSAEIPRSHEAPPIRVFTLGAFAVTVRGRPLRFSGRAPRRPFDLLKAVIALGGDQVPESRLIDALWSDSEADAAPRALAISLHRLRALLGEPRAIVRQGGALRLDARHVWVDAAAVARLVSARPTDPAGPGARLEQVLALYRGPFLGGDAPPSWAIGLRERLRHRFLRHAGEQHDQLERAGDERGAESLCLRVLDVEPHAEAFYVRLMRAYARQGRPAEATAVHRRCRETLAADLGVAPSAEMETLLRGLRRS